MMGEEWKLWDRVVVPGSKQVLVLRHRALAIANFQTHVVPNLLRKLNIGELRFDTAAAQTNVTHRGTMALHAKYLQDLAQPRSSPAAASQGGGSSMLAAVQRSASSRMQAQADVAANATPILRRQSRGAGRRKSVDEYNTTALLHTIVSCEPATHVPSLNYSGIVEIMRGKQHHERAMRLPLADVTKTSLLGQSAKHLGWGLEGMVASEESPGRLYRVCFAITASQGWRIAAWPGKDAISFCSCAAGMQHRPCKHVARVLVDALLA